MSEDISIEQFKIAMDEISEVADCAKRLCVQAIAETTAEQDAEAVRLVTLGAVIEKIGCIAALHGKSCDDDPKAWMLPPSYRYAAEASNQDPSD